MDNNLEGDIMHFIEMINLIKHKYDISICSHINYSTIFEIEYITDTPTIWSEHTLYIGDFSKIKDIPSLPIMILTTDDAPLKGRLPSGSCCGKIETKDVHRIVIMAKEILCEDLKSQAILFEIAQAAVNDKDIASLIDNAASLIGNALILVDSKMNVLVHSTSFEIMDPLWVDNIKEGHYSYEFIQKVKGNKVMQEWVKGGEETKIITLEGDLQAKLVTRITQKGHIVGALIMIAHHTPINRNHMNQLPQIGKILFNKFSKGFEDDTYKSFHSAVLFHLLSGDGLSDTFDFITLSQADFPEEMSVVVVRFIERVQNRYLKMNIASELERIFQDGYLVHYKNYIGILVSEISLEQENKLLSLATSEDVNIGVSWPFNDVLDFRRYFYQAVASIKQAQSFGKTNRVLKYRDYSFYDLLFNYSGRIPLHNFSHPALKILKEYDESNNTEFYITLETFLNSSLNIKTTAEILFLHRNSVNYRLNKIIELTNLDLDNNETVFSLVDSFRIQKFLNSRDKLDM